MTAVLPESDIGPMPFAPAATDWLRTLPDIGQSRD